MLSQCPKCSLSKSTGPMGSVLPQCQCDWKLPTAQSEQEPVISKWVLREVYFDEDGEPIAHRSTPQRSKSSGKPSAWVRLTEEEIETIWRKVEAGDFHDCVLPFAEKLEAKLKEKNT